MKIFTKILILIIFVLASNTSFAQSSNSQTLNFKDISPGVVGELNIYSETLSEDKGIVSVTGSLRYEFPPQPTTFSITLRNSDGKGVFKDYTQTITTSTPSRFSFVFENIPLDKTSTTRDLATRDKFQIISSVDKGVDFFFQSPTYITFKKYVAPKTTTTTINNQTTTSLDPISSNISLLSRLSVLSTTPVPDANGKKRVRATLMLVSHLAQNQELPVYGGLARLDGDKVEFNTDQWQRVSTRGTADDMPGMATGITRHDFILEQGKTYTFWAWLSINPLTEINPSGNEILPVDAFTSTMFVVNSDYLFGKPVSNSAPVLQKTNNAKSKAILNSLTSDYRAGNIDFFTIGSTNVSTKASDNAYVFLTNIPGLANSTSTPVKNATDCGPSNPDCKAFDPTIDGAFNDFISTIINMIYGFVILGAAIRIIISGIKLMGSVTPFGKNTAKEEIINAFIAIALALGTYLILNTINPKLTKFSVGNVLKGSGVNTFEGVKFSVLEESELGGVIDVEGQVLNGSKQNIPSGVYCPGKGGRAEMEKIVNSLVNKNKVAYRWNGKTYTSSPFLTVDNSKHFKSVCPSGKKCNDYCPSGKICLDCGGFVDMVTSCAGLKYEGEKFHSASYMYRNNAKKIDTFEFKNGKLTVNGNIEVRVGDVLSSKGHVFIYMGNGFVVDSHIYGNSQTGGDGDSVGYFQLFTEGTQNTVTKKAYQLKGLVRTE